MRRQGKVFEADEYLKALKSNYPDADPDIFEMISFEEVENIKRDIKTRLNELQDEIDEINGSTFIEYEADLIK